jgi:hypothetical protein
MNNAVPWICPTCNTSIATFYCPACGERPLNPRELTLRGLVDHAVHAFTSIDGRLLRTFRSLVRCPGELTLAYLHGRRQPYVGPISLFLIANVLFFATESLTGGTVFTAPLGSHLKLQPWSVFAGSLVSSRLESLHTTLAFYTPVFDLAMARNARSFIIFMALLFALLPRIMFPQTKWPFVAHAVFSLHLYTFMLLLFCIATPIESFNRLLGGAGFGTQGFDAVLSLTLLAACAVYLYIATGAVYGGRLAIRALKTGALTVGVAVIVLGYRFSLFLITLYTT